MKLWHTRTWDCQQTIEAAEKLAVTRLAWSPDGDYLAIGNMDCTVQLWNVVEQRLERLFQGQYTWILALVCSADGQWLAFNGDQGQVHVWERSIHQLHPPLNAHPQFCWSVLFLPQQQLLTGGGEGIIHHWDLTTQENIATFEGHQAPVTRLALSPNPDWLMSSSHDGTIRFWDLSRHTNVQTFTSPRPYEGLLIQDVTGLTPMQCQTLTLLGAVTRA